MDLETAFAPIAAEMRELLPADAVVVDAHTHLGKDEDGQSLEPGALIEFLDQVGRGCARVHVPAARSGKGARVSGSE